MENVAKQFLINNQCKIIVQNYQCKFGEIDIIAKLHNIIVFIEVKYRKSEQYGGAISAVPISKQKKIKKTARFFLQQLKLNEYNTNCRFDTVTLQGDVSKPEITWLPNAF